MRIFLAFVFICLGTTMVLAQINKRLPTTGSTQTQRYNSQGRALPNSPQQQGGNSLVHRDNTDNSITIHFRYFDSTRIRTLNSTINDFTTRYPVPAHYVTLGNFGTAAHSLLFNPNLTPGFDPGFHAFDIYRFKVEDTRFYQTTRPYTELGYMLGSKAEQMINLVHTQNITPDFNMALQYRLINSPGNFQNQNTSDNSYRINGDYQSRNRRYSAYGIYIVNKLQSSENGGLQSDSLLNKGAPYTNRFILPTRLSGDSNATRNPFNTRITTGNVYRESEFLFRHQYDFGQSDSLIVNDSTVVRLFYPRFRLQHNLILHTQQFEFHDLYAGRTKQADYQKYFDTSFLNSGDFAVYNDKWNRVENEFSIISFPEKKNLNQFLKAGAGFENIKAQYNNIVTTPGTFDTVTSTNHNLYVSGEYRNRTRNQKWDIEGVGKFYLNGLNSGDYAVQVHLKRLISAKLGYLDIGFQNVNRTPSFIFSGQGSFPVAGVGNLNKENTTRLSGSIINDALRFSLSGEYFLGSNYTYFSSFNQAAQEGTLFNILHVSGKKSFKLSKTLNLFSEVHLQQTTGNPPINLPLFFTNNRLSFDGVYYTNMHYSIGVEVRYHSPYKADDYSPFVGQFFYQNSLTISNRPTLNGFFDFRIKTFKAFVRLENLNSFGRNTGSFGFNKNNVNAPHYPEPGMWFRLGIWWTFIN